MCSGCGRGARPIWATGGVAAPNRVVRYKEDSPLEAIETQKDSATLVSPALQVRIPDHRDR